MAAIAAMLLLRPVHLGIDNSATVRNLRRILACSFDPRLAFKNRDGYLVAILAGLVEQRGHASVRVSK
eukprot:12494064-Alexandrium_andersonii.AAC.1